MKQNKMKAFNKRMQMQEEERKNRMRKIKEEEVFLLI
jgi:hypothetical protein